MLRGENSPLNIIIRKKLYFKGECKVGKLKARNYGSWIFRILLVISLGVMIWSWLMPWWSISVPEMKVYDMVVIHPWGLDIYSDITAYVYGAAMPGWFAPMMWTYLGLCIAALVLSMFMKDKKVKLWKFNLTLPNFIIGLVGFSYVVVVITMVIVASIRVGDFYDAKLIGVTLVEPLQDHYYDAYSGLRYGYFTACGVGPALILLALLRNKIIKKPKIETIE